MSREEAIKCGDNRFELIGKYKAKLIDSTNIEGAPEEMAVIDNILFRFWQMGWLDALEQEPCEDVISREAVYQLLMDKASDAYGFEEIRKIVDELSSVQPSRNKRCEWGRMRFDVITKDIIFEFSDGTEKLVSQADQENVVTLSRGEYDRLKALQPSRKGHWLFDSPHYVCSACNHVHHWNRFDVVSGCKLGNYCPNCGAYMAEMESEE